MHTRVDIMYLSDLNEAELGRVTIDIKQALNELERAGNCFDSGSELSEVNRSASHEEVALSPLLFEMLTICLKYNKSTLGLFDITIDSTPFGPWSIKTVSINDQHRICFKQHPTLLKKIPLYFKQSADLFQTDAEVETAHHTRLNLSGILKGFALDSIRRILKKYGILNALINMGNSSVFAVGKSESASGWSVQLQNRSGGNILLSDECLTTSGNETSERRHILNPLTGQIVEGRRSVSVVTAGGAEGEALSTALFLADKEQKKTLIEKFRIKRVIETV